MASSIYIGGHAITYSTSLDNYRLISCLMHFPSCLELVGNLKKSHKIVAGFEETMERQLFTIIRLTRPVEHFCRVLLQSIKRQALVDYVTRCAPRKDGVMAIKDSSTWNVAIIA